MSEGQDRTHEVTADAIRAHGVVASDRLRAHSILPPGPPSRLVVDGFATVHRDGRIDYADGYGPEEASRAFWDAVGWRARDSTATSSERPGCATSIREAGEVTTEVRLLALPAEPPVGSEVELRMPTWTFRYVRHWIGEYNASAWGEPCWFAADDGCGSGGPHAWRQLCAQALGGELWLTREGPAEEATGA